VRDLLGLTRLFVAGLVPNLAYLAVGLWLLRPLRLEARGSERLALGFVFGSGAASLAILGLRLLDLPVPLGGLALVALAGLPRLREGGTQAPASEEAPRGSRAVDGATLALAILTFMVALGPNTFWDGFEYHLPMVQAWSHGPIRALPGMLDAEFRAGVDLLYLPAVASGEPDAAAAVSACFAVALAALIRAEARRRASPGAAAWAGLFSLMAPFTLENAPSTYVDLGVGAYGFVALLLADRWNRGGGAPTLAACAVALAFAANAKLHALALAPAVVVLVALGGRPVALRQALPCAALAVGLVAPWLLKSTLTTGNPFFPFFAAWLGAGATTLNHLGLRTFRLSTDFPTPDLVGRFPRYLLSLGFGRNPHVSGLAGALPLALAPLAWHRLTRATAVLVATLLVLFVLQVRFMPALRFGTPLLPFAAVAAAVGGTRLAHSGEVARRTLALVIPVLLLHHSAVVALRYGPRIPALRDPARYEAVVFPDQAALREVVRRAEPVVAIRGGAVAWMPKPVYVLNWERNGEIFFDRVAGRETPQDALLALLRRRGVHSLVLDAAPSWRTDGSIGNPAVDTWLRTGEAAARVDPQPLHAREGRIWVLIDLRDRGAAAAP
jgi:hypothetical protein